MEIWKAIPGWEGSYEASDQGRIRSVDRRVWKPTYTTQSGLERSGHWHTYKGRILLPGTQDGYGHCSVALGRGNSIAVHILVAKTFLGPNPGKLDVAHSNGKGGDNRASNLGYATRSMNNIDCFYHGKSRSLFTEKDIRYIRSVLAGKGKRGDLSKLALKYNASVSAISSIKTRRTHSYIV